MSDQIAHTPLQGPTTYDFGQATPEEWPRGEYVPKAIYDALAAELAEQHQKQKAVFAQLTVAEARIATLEAIADARMTRIDELEAAYNEARVCLTYVRSWCDIDDVAMQLRMERWLDNEIRDSALETIAEPDKCANCGHSVQAHAADSGHCSCGQCSGFIPFAVNRGAKDGR